MYSVYVYDWFDVLYKKSQMILRGLAVNRVNWLYSQWALGLWYLSTPPHFTKFLSSFIFSFSIITDIVDITDLQNYIPYPW